MFYQNFFKKFIKFFTIISLSQLLVVSSFAAGGGDDSKKMDVNEMIKPKIINGLDLTFSSCLSLLFEEEKFLSFLL